MRLFVALQIPSAVKDALAALLSSFRAIGAESSRSRPKWIRPENLHITLKFLGEINPEKMDLILSELSQVRSTQPATARFHGLGFFPAAKQPRVLWVGVEASPNLATLAAEIDARLEKTGLPREKRDFTPHLTLARFEPPVISDRLRASIEENTTRDFGYMRAAEFHLIQSKLKSGGAEYTTLQSFRFATEE